MNKIFLIIIILALLSSCNQKKSTETKDFLKSKTELKKMEDTPKSKTIIIEYKTKTGKIFIINEEKPSASISKITLTTKGFTEVNEPLQLEESDPFDHAFVADINGDDFDELYIITRSVGSGSYANIYGFSSNKDKSVTPIFIPELSDDDFVKFFPKYMGHDTFYIENNKLMRKYKQFKKEDEQCCPTGEMKFLQYILKMGEASWILKVKK